MLPLQVLEARSASEKAQLLLSNVAERKRRKQAQRDGLIILEGLYGDIKRRDASDQSDAADDVDEDGSDLPPPNLDVTVPLQFLVDDSGELRVRPNPCPRKTTCMLLEPLKGIDCRRMRSHLLESMTVGVCSSFSAFHVGSGV